MINSSYLFLMEILDEQGEVVGKSLISGGWERAREWLKLQMLRRTGSALGCLERQVHAEPLWHVEAGAPYLWGFRICAGEAASARFSGDFDITYWSAHAQEAIEQLVEQNALQPGETANYRVLAYPRGAESRPAPGGLTIEEVSVDPPLHISSLAEFADNSSPFGLLLEGDTPVFIPASVLEDTATLKNEAGAREIGGALVGRLHRDPACAELFVEVTGHIPARHTTSDMTRLSFTAETWLDLRQSVAQRGDNEMLVGWYHSHPTREWANGDESSRKLVAYDDFFSEQDCLVQRTAFPSAFMTGLVVSDRMAGEGVWRSSWALFGWHRGAIARRGFHVMAANGSQNASEEADMAARKG